MPPFLSTRINPQGNGVMKLFDGSYSDLMELRSLEKSEESKSSGKTIVSRGEESKQFLSKVTSEDTSTVSVKEAENGSNNAPKKLLKLGYREKLEYEVGLFSSLPSFSFTSSLG